MDSTVEKIIGGFVIFLLLIGLFLWASYSSMNGGEPSFDDGLGNSDDETFEEETIKGLEEVSQEVVLADFPTGLPIEEGIIASESYKHVPGGDAGEQSTVSYLSSRGMDENFENFKQFMIDNEYEITNEVEEENMRFAYASNGGADISVLIRNTGGKILVNISYLNKE